jgi:hypothetical protein
MSPATIRLHTVLIRLLRGVVGAWEAWLKEEHGVEVRKH